MENDLRTTIKEIIRGHLKKKIGKVFGQCLTAVGWVGGTLPEMYEKDGMVEVSMADVADGGFVVGAALMNSRPIYVIRYQGFNWYNAPMIVNYACKSQEIWNNPCPVLIRGIAMEGGIGPVAGSSHHSLFHRMPGNKIIAPMTPNEYQIAYDAFMKDDDVYYVSEHRRSYDNQNELDNVIENEADFTLFPISITRFDAEKARIILKDQGYKINIIHQLWIKPFIFKEEWKNALNGSKYGGMVLDDDYEEGVASSIAHNMMIESNKKVYTLGLEHRTAGFHPDVDNLPPSPENIAKNVKSIIESKK